MADSPIKSVPAEDELGVSNRRGFFRRLAGIGIGVAASPLTSTPIQPTNWEKWVISIECTDLIKGTC